MRTVYDINGNPAVWTPNMRGELFNEPPVRTTKESGMKTLYLKDGTEIKRDGVDARDYVRAGLATYEKPEIVTQQDIVIDATANKESVEVEVEKQIRRGRKPKGE